MKMQRPLLMANLDYIKFGVNIQFLAALIVSKFRSLVNQKGKVKQRKLIFKFICSKVIYQL